MPNKPKSAAIYNPFTAKSRAAQSAQEMYPGKIGQDDQRDAARHMLASGYLAKAWSPGVADLIGKAHEFKETPFRHLGALAGMAQHRYDRPIDLHNNTLGIELAQKAGSMEEFERLVNEAAERARPTQTPGAPWVPSAKDAEAMRKGSTQYAGGGLVKGALAAVKKAAEAAGQKAPVTAEKELTTLQDMHTNLGDRVRARSMEAQKMMEGFDYKYDKGQRVFTKDSAGKNKPPYTILNRTRTGNQPVRGDHPELGPGMGKVVIDPETGKAMRTPYEPGYRVRMESGPEDWTEFEIPESAIIGDLEMARGGSVAAFKDGGAATGVFPQMKPRRAVNSGAGERMSEEALKFSIPQDTTDLALLALPFGKAGTAAAAGLLALTPADAEAGKLKTGVDLARRSFFGLKPSQDMAGRELVPVQKDLDRMQAELAKAPKVEQKTTTVQPSPTAPKIEQTVKKIAETPVSRRTVLKSAAGQVMQNALPASSFADLMKPATVAKQAVQAAAPTYGLASVPGLVAKFMREGMTPEEAGRAVEKMVPNVLEKWPEVVADRIRAPAETMPHVSEGTPLMTIFGEMIKPAFQTSPFGLRPQMRELQRLSPEDYSALKETARDIKEYGFEP